MDIILLILAAMHIGRMAASKGLPAGSWRWKTVLAWLAFEFIGLMFTYVFLGIRNMISLSLIGLASGIGGYLLMRYRLEKYEPADTSRNE